MPIGKCPKCGKGPRWLGWGDENTGKASVCRSCHRGEVEKGICPTCGHGDKEPILLINTHPKTGKKICPVCYLKATGQMRAALDRANLLDRKKRAKLAVTRKPKKKSIVLRKRKLGPSKSSAGALVAKLLSSPAIETPRTQNSQKPHTTKDSGCKHHWEIDPPTTMVSKGVCKLCGEKRQFPNLLSDCIYDPNKERLHEDFLADESYLVYKPGEIPVQRNNNVYGSQETY